MLHQPIYDELKRVAQRHETTTYSAIAPLAGLDMDSQADGDTIRQILTTISTHEHQQARPMLTAIVVHRQDNIPGRGFFELAQRLGLLRPGRVLLPRGRPRPRRVAAAPERAMSQPVLELQRYFVWGDRMRVQFGDVLRSARNEQDVIDAHFLHPYLAYWYAATHLLIEGWQALGISDSEVDAHT
jgi:hypothetical protein